MPIQVKSLESVKNIIAVASGKGGVGKSTTSVNLALALAQEGAEVGILDADIYGPNQPQMLGVQQQRPEQTEAKKLKPIIAHGIQSMSIGYLLNQDDTPVIWRGPMVSGALQQLLYDTQWNALDYLIIDLPPGTGDIQLTLAQKIPVTAAIVVTTPQDIALLDARKAIQMFAKVNISVLGIVENMSIHVCENCGHAEYIFGEGGGKKIAEAYGIPFLGALPLNAQIRAQTDAGNPTCVASPDSIIALTYREIARKIITGLAQQSEGAKRKFPKIVIKA